MAGSVAASRMVVARREVRRVGRERGGSFFRVRPCVRSMLSVPSCVLTSSGERGAKLVLGRVARGGNLGIRMILHMRASGSEGNLGGSVVST